MSDRPNERPKLRPVEAIPLADGKEGTFALHDPSGFAEVVLTVSEPALFILSLLDGRNAAQNVIEKFEARYGQRLGESTLADIVKDLAAARLLDGPEFEAHLEELLSEYRAAPVRKSVYGNQLGAPEQVRTYLAEMLAPPNDAPTRNGPIVGLIAPHLDYPRGGPCYAKAYGVLHGHPRPDRCVILGTNHFGRSTSVVATVKSFQTPLGVTQVDTSFLEAVEKRCGFNLREGELDHQREHSIEMQVMCLQHLFGSGTFTIIPFLCPDPCGATGTKPLDGRGVDLRDFARALTEEVEADGADTLLVAGADLSHVGRQFGDTFRLDESFLASVEQRDRRALEHIESSRPDGFLSAIAEEDNPTRVCSAGCMFVVATVLRDATPTMLGYHQAFNAEAQICVSCTAMIYAR